MKRIEEKEELKKYFDEKIKGRESFFEVLYQDGTSEKIVVVKYEKFLENGDDWYLEAPLGFVKYEVKPGMLEPYYDEEEGVLEESPFLHMYEKDGYFHELEWWQTQPFLEAGIQIKFITDDADEILRMLVDENV